MIGSFTNPLNDVAWQYLPQQSFVLLFLMFQRELSPMLVPQLPIKQYEECPCPQNRTGVLEYAARSIPVTQPNVKACYSEYRHTDGTGNRNRQRSGAKSACCKHRDEYKAGRAINQSIWNQYEDQYDVEHSEHVQHGNT